MGGNARARPPSRETGPCRGAGGAGVRGRILPLRPPAQDVHPGALEETEAAGPGAPGPPGGRLVYALYHEAQRVGRAPAARSFARGAGLVREAGCRST